MNKLKPYFFLCGSVFLSVNLLNNRGPTVVLTGFSLNRKQKNALKANLVIVQDRTLSKWFNIWPLPTKQNISPPIAISI